MTSRRLHLTKEGSELRAGTGPHGWGAQNAGFIGGRSEGRAEHPSHENRGKKNWRMNAAFSVKKRKPFDMKYKSLGFCKTV